MAKRFKDLVDKMLPASRARIKKRTAQMASEMALRKLPRDARNMMNGRPLRGEEEGREEDIKGEPQ